MLSLQIFMCIMRTRVFSLFVVFFLLLLILFLLFCLSGEVTSARPSTSWDVVASPAAATLSSPVLPIKRLQAEGGLVAKSWREWMPHRYESSVELVPHRADVKLLARTSPTAWVRSGSGCGEGGALRTPPDSPVRFEGDRGAVMADRNANNSLRATSSRRTASAAT